MQFWVDLLDNSLARIGYGPITTATQWTSTARLDRAGSFSFTMPAADPMAAYLDYEVIARCYGLVNGAVQCLGSGIISSIELASGQPDMLTVSGDDMLRELTYLPVRSDGVDAELAINELVEHAYGAMAWDETHEDGAPDEYGRQGYTHELHYVTAPCEIHTTANQGGFYLGFDRHCTAVDFVLTNADPGGGAGTRWEYWSSQLDGAWARLEGIVDTTAVTEDYVYPLAQSGRLSYNDMPDWIKCTLDGDTEERYWIRLYWPSSIPATIYMTSVQPWAIYPTKKSIQTIIGKAPAGWSLNTTDGYDETKQAIYSSLSDESVLEAAVKIAEATGEHFRAGEGREVVWLQDDNPNSGIRCIGPSDVVAAEQYSDLAFIISLRRTGDSYERVTGVYPRGGGIGSGAALTIANSTETHAGYTVDTATNHVYATGRTIAIDRPMDWTDIVPLTGSADDIEMAANTLLQKAIAYLNDHSAPQYSYNITVAHCEQRLYPGETVRVAYRRVVGAYVATNIDADLYLLEVQTQIDNSGIRTVAMQAATVKRWARSEGEAVARLLRQTRDTTRRRQLINGDDVRSAINGLPNTALMSLGGGIAGWRKVSAASIQVPVDSVTGAVAKVSATLDANGYPQVEMVPLEGTDLPAIAHSDLTGIGADDHHDQAHAHDGVDGSGTVAHSATTGIGADDHHAQDHASEHITGGGDIIPDAESGGDSGLMSGASLAALEALVASTGIAARAYNSGALTISNNSLTWLTFSSTRDNSTDGMHSTSSNTGRLTAPVAGWYLITAAIRWASNATGVRQLYLRANGSTYIDTVNQDAVGTTNTRQTIATLYYLAANEYVEAAVYQNSGGNLDVDASAAISPEFAMARIA